MFVTAVVTALLAQTLPSISLACERNERGNCILNYEGKPLARVDGTDAEHALKFYQPYFTCYYGRLTGDDGFGSPDAETATAAMLRAGQDCAEERVRADQLLDDLLVERKVYGDEHHRAFVREFFRREAGSAFVYATAQEEGLGEQVETMSEAYVQTQVSGQ